MSSPQALIFDWDNTLVDSWPTILAATNATMEAMGHPTWTMADAKARVRRSMRDEFPETFGPRWEEAARVFYATFGRLHLTHLDPCEGAEEMLRRLQDAGHSLSVVSNKTGDLLRKEAEHLGWNRYFDKLVGAGDAERDKPASAPVELALSGSGISPGKTVWFVGDTDIDLECADRSGCVPVLLRGEPPGADEFSEYPPRHHFASCLDLWSHVEMLMASA